MVEYKCKYNSWVKAPELDDAQKKYLTLLEEIFRVKSGNEWVSYNLTPHQILWHIRDVAFLKWDAKIRVVKKSRDTSYTVSSIISDIMAVPEHTNEICPYFKMNSPGAMKFIESAKGIIRHMMPIKMKSKVINVGKEKYSYVKYSDYVKVVYGINNQKDIDKLILEQEQNNEIEVKTNITYYPFNPKECGMKAKGSIRFPNGVTWEAYPANDIAAENARGLRTIISSGGIDESNFMKNFEDIYVAIRDSYAGHMGEDHEGQSLQQINIGTTLKGETPFSIWLNKEEKMINNEIVEVFDWPVFDRELFKPYENLNNSIESMLPFHENKELVPIVPWHQKRHLWNLYKQNQHQFFEEYMAIQVDSDYQWYSTMLILNSTNQNSTFLPEKFDEINTETLESYDKFRCGCDPASINDYFSFTIYGHSGKLRKQLFVLNKTKVHINDMFHELVPIIDSLIKINTDFKLTIDASPIGLQLTQMLQKRFGYNYIRGVTGNKRVKTVNKNQYKINPYGHTLLKKFMLDGEIELLNDELQIKHFQSIGGDFKPLKDSNGHGDSCMSTMYANLPDNLERAQDLDGAPLTENDIIDLEQDGKFGDMTPEEIVKDFDNWSFEDKMSFYGQT